MNTHDDDRIKAALAAVHCAPSIPLPSPPATYGPRSFAVSTSLKHSSAPRPVTYRAP